MIRIILSWLMMVLLIKANSSRFETSFFSPDQEKFTLNFSLKESEFTSYLQQHPHQLSKGPLVIVSFVIPTPYFSYQGNRLSFYSDQDHRRMIRQYSFTIVYSSKQFEPVVFGGNKKFHPFGFHYESQNTFYLVLPTEILNQKKFYLIARECGKEGDQVTQIPFYNCQSADGFMTDRQLYDSKVNRRLDGEESITTIDASGQFFLKIDLTRLNSSLRLSIQVKNISGRIQSFDPNRFILTIPGCGVLKPNYDPASTRIVLGDSEFSLISIGFELPELPRLNNTKCDLSYHSGSIRFEKGIIL